MASRSPRARRLTRRRGRTAPRAKLKQISIRIVGTDLKEVERFSYMIVEILKARGARVSGPVRLPTKKLWLSVRKSPCGEGTPTYDFYELPIYKRLINVMLSQRDLFYIVQLSVPPNTHVEFRIS